MKKILGFLALLCVVATIAVLLYARNPHSDVVSVEMHEIDPPAPSHGI